MFNTHIVYNTLQYIFNTYHMNSYEFIIYMHTKQGVNTGIHRHMLRCPLPPSSNTFNIYVPPSIKESPWRNGFGQMASLLHSSLKKLRNSFRSSEIFRTLAAQSDFNGFRCYRRVPERGTKHDHQDNQPPSGLSHHQWPILTRQYSKARASVATLSMTEKHVFWFWNVLNGFESCQKKKGEYSLIYQLMLLISNLRLILRFNLNLKK